MMKSRNSKKTPKIVPLPPVSLGITVKENLPYPVVHYPNHYGTFIAFSMDYDSQAYLCSCARSAVENYLKLRSLSYSNSTYERLSNAPLSDREFPTVIAEISQRISFENGEIDSIFVSNLCHRCNMKTSSVRWCHEVYGVKFVQYYGWYIYQTYFRLGIFPGAIFNPYLPEVCPEEIQQVITAARLADDRFRSVEARILRMTSNSERADITDDEIKNFSNVKSDGFEDFVRLRREALQLRRKYTSKIENIARAEFGFKKIGEGWVSETLLYNIITHLYPNHLIIRHHRPNWLDRLELDIFLPDLKLAFEYQGQQHFHAIKAWGGEKALKDLQERDKKKAHLCHQNGITLITIDYTEPLTDEYLRHVISQKISKDT